MSFYQVGYTKPGNDKIHADVVVEQERIAWAKNTAQFALDDMEEGLVVVHVERITVQKAAMLVKLGAKLV